MSKKELRPVYSIGMFDFLKGVAILSVIILHSYCWIPSLEQHQTFRGILTPLSNLLVYSLAIAAGFGIRKRPIRKCAQQLKKNFLIPYLITGLATTILYSFNYYFLFSDYALTFRAGICIFLSFALGIFPTASLCGYILPGVGPVWFVIALAGGWFILNLILNYSSSWKRHLLVLLSCLVGYFGNRYALTYSIPIPFCFFYMFFYVPGLYIGYLARKNNWFKKKLSPILLVLIAVSLAAFLWKWNSPLVLSNLYPFERFANLLEFFTFFVALTACFGVTYLMTHINRRENVITNILEPIGYNSITILCIHTVEYTGMHWYWFRDTLHTSSIGFIVMILIYRLVFIALGMLVVKSFQTWGGFARLKELFSKKEVG